MSVFTTTERVAAVRRAFDGARPGYVFRIGPMMRKLEPSNPPGGGWFGGLVRHLVRTGYVERLGSAKRGPSVKFALVKVLPDGDELPDLLAGVYSPSTGAPPHPPGPPPEPGPAAPEAVPAAPPASLYEVADALAGEVQQAGTPHARAIATILRLVATVAENQVDLRERVARLEALWS